MDLLKVQKLLLSFIIRLNIQNLLSVLCLKFDDVDQTNKLALSNKENSFTFSFLDTYISLFFMGFWFQSGCKFIYQYVLLFARLFYYGLFAVLFSCSKIFTSTSFSGFFYRTYSSNRNLYALHNFGTGLYQ